MIQIPGVCSKSSQSIHQLLWHGTSAAKGSLLALSVVLEANIFLHDEIESHNTRECISFCRGPWLCSFETSRLNPVQQPRARDQDKLLASFGF
jgi:hypothetical protein